MPNADQYLCNGEVEEEGGRLCSRDSPLLMNMGPESEGYYRQGVGRGDEQLGCHACVL